MGIWYSQKGCILHLPPVFSLVLEDFSLNILTYTALFPLQRPLLCCFDRQAGSSEYIQLPIQWASEEERVHSLVGILETTLSDPSEAILSSVYMKWSCPSRLLTTSQISTGPLLKVHVFSGLFASSGYGVDKRTRNNLYTCTCTKL